MGLLSCRKKDGPLWKGEAQVPLGKARGKVRLGRTVVGRTVVVLWGTMALAKVRGMGASVVSILMMMNLQMRAAAQTKGTTEMLMRDSATEIMAIRD